MLASSRRPVVSRFFGIVIALGGSRSTALHAKYSGDEAMIDIRTGEVVRGSLPRRALSLVDEWRQLHVGELLNNWERAQRRQPLTYIAPLE